MSGQSGRWEAVLSAKARFTTAPTRASGIDGWNRSDVEMPHVELPH
ncbi:MAG: hypothetical protein ACKVQU_12520 [Burkholderiales bacterium]